MYWVQHLVQVEDSNLHLFSFKMCREDEVNMYTIVKTKVYSSNIKQYIEEAFTFCNNRTQVRLLCIDKECAVLPN